MGFIGGLGRTFPFPPLISVVGVGAVAVGSAGAVVGFRVVGLGPVDSVGVIGFGVGGGVIGLIAGGTLPFPPCLSVVGVGAFVVGAAGFKGCVVGLIAGLGVFPPVDSVGVVGFATGGGVAGFKADGPLPLGPAAGGAGPLGPACGGAGPLGPGLVVGAGVFPPVYAGLGY